MASPSVCSSPAAFVSRSPRSVAPVTATLSASGASHGGAASSVGADVEARTRGAGVVGVTHRLKGFETDWKAEAEPRTNAVVKRPLIVPTWC